MRWLALWVTVLCLWLVAGSQAATVFYLYEFNTNNSLGSVFAGGAYDFWVQMSTDKQFVAAAYEVVLPTTTWWLSGRDYGSYGWDTTPMANWGWDGSVPLQTASGYPYSVTNGLYSGTPNTPDFLFSTARADLVPVTGALTMEKFSLLIPQDTAPGVYDLTVTNPRIFDMDGNPADPVVGVGNTFHLTVAVPEPGTVALFGLGLIGLAFVRRRLVA